MSNETLSPQQQAMVQLWDAHMKHEFETQSVDETMETMTSTPFVNHVPVMTGGVGYDEVRGFYGASFISQHPADTEIFPISRTVGTDKIFEELIYKCTHDIEMPWMLPGVPPTVKRIEEALVVDVLFENGKIAGERIYWDQATVLAQIGLIDTETLPVTGIEASRKVVDPASEPSNRLIERAG